MPYSPTNAATGALQFDGRFSDGRTAEAHDVRVGFSPRGLVLRIEGASEDLIWPYGALSTAEPISSHAIDALVSYAHQPGASVFVPNGTFARQLAEMAPQLTTRAARRRAATPWIWAALGVVLVAGGVWAAQLSPARAIASLLPHSVRDTLGRQTINAMASGKAVCETPDGSKALARMMERLSAGTPASTRFEITVVDWDLVNAFAAPGNKIVLTRGVIEKAGGPDEIAGILAHEMGHGIELHPESGIVRAIGLTAAVELMMGGSGGTVGNLGIMLAQLSYSRQAEAAADDQALALMRAAQISPDGLLAFFRRMSGDEESSNGHDEFAFDILRTHPATRDRIRRIAAEQRYDTKPALSATDWKQLKSICRDATSE